MQRYYFFRIRTIFFTAGCGLKAAGAGEAGRGRTGRGCDEGRIF